MGSLESKEREREGERIKSWETNRWCNRAVVAIRPMQLPTTMSSLKRHIKSILCSSLRFQSKQLHSMKLIYFQISKKFFFFALFFFRSFHFCCYWASRSNDHLCAIAFTICLMSRTNNHIIFQLNRKVRCELRARNEASDWLHDFWIDLMFALLFPWNWAPSKENRANNRLSIFGCDANSAGILMSIRVRFIPQIFTHFDWITNVFLLTGALLQKQSLGRNLLFQQSCNPRTLFEFSCSAFEQLEKHKQVFSQSAFVEFENFAKTLERIVFRFENSRFPKGFENRENAAIRFE